jgi:hypothetical protein
MSMVVFPFTFLSSAYVPVATMAGWLRVFAENQPITPMVDAVRALTLGDVAPTVLGHDTMFFVARARCCGLPRLCRCSLRSRSFDTVGVEVMGTHVSWVSANGVSSSMR